MNKRMDIGGKREGERKKCRIIIGEREKGRGVEREREIKIGREK